MSKEDQRNEASVERPTEEVTMKEADASVAAKEAEDDTEASEEDNTTCPLFMIGLPRDFSANPHLAALASLMNENDSDATATEDAERPATAQKKSDQSAAAPMHGGGKASRRSHRTTRQSQPYATTRTKSKQKSPKATVGEAQLFLKMWKL